jgi:C4-type Zn-finger protein
MKDKIYSFYKKLEQFKEGALNFTLIIDDPLDNSFL